MNKMNEITQKKDLFILLNEIQRSESVKWSTLKWKASIEYWNECDWLDYKHSREKLIISQKEQVMTIKFKFGQKYIYALKTVHNKITH